MEKGHMKYQRYRREAGFAGYRPWDLFQRERCSQSPNLLARSPLSCADRGLGCECTQLPVCRPLLKCDDTGDSSVLLCAMSNRPPLTLRWNGWPVSPTYCWPHLLHVINTRTAKSVIWHFSCTIFFISCLFYQLYYQNFLTFPNFLSCLKCS